MELNKKICLTTFDAQNLCYTDQTHYSIFWMKEGFNSVQIDFETFRFQRNSIYFIPPGRHVTLEFDSAPKGWILKFSRNYYHQEIREKLIFINMDFFEAIGEVPKIILSPKIGSRVNEIAGMINELLVSEMPNREVAIASLLNTLLIYCQSNCNIEITQLKNSRKLEIVSSFKELVGNHFTHIHQVSEYARMMNLSPRYLNQVVKQILGKTAKSYIQEQLLVQARRELKFSTDSIKQIAFKLGFSEPFYFSNYFKKQMGCSPTDYRNQ